MYDDGATDLSRNLNTIPYNFIVWNVQEKQNTEIASYYDVFGVDKLDF